MKTARFALVFFCLSCPALAGGLPFFKEIAGDLKLPRPIGISVDYYTMSQGYNIEDLSFTLSFPFEFPLPDFDLLDVKNEVDYADIKLDAWLLPFLNVIAVVGDLNGRTDVDLSVLGLEEFGIPLSTLSIRYDGLVYGGGLVLAGGGEYWFGSVAATYTKTDVTGDFESSVTSIAVQPRFGFNGGRYTMWVGAFGLSADENHQGDIELPFLGTVAFEIDLAEEEKWNTVAGFQATLGKHIDVLLEGGFGSRDHFLASFGYRF